VEPPIKPPNKLGSYPMGMSLSNHVTLLMVLPL
jgi:hypothetical protein